MQFFAFFSLALSFHLIHGQSNLSETAYVGLVNATATAVVRDPCGPLTQPSPNPAGNTCNVSIIDSKSPAPYGVQCLTDYTDTHVNFDACSNQTIPAICDKLADPAVQKGTWIWASANPPNQCYMGFYLPPYDGSVKKPEKDECVNEIFRPMLGYCNPATGYEVSEGMYNLGMVNVKIKPDETQDGQAVDVGYPSYIMATKQLTAKSNNVLVPMDPAGYAQGVHAYPQTDAKNPDSNGSLNLSSPNLLPSRFSSLTLTYGGLFPNRFTATDIALAFIAAMAQQALEPFDARLPYFEFTDVETPVRILMRSALSAPTAMTVRSNVMWALKQLPIDLFHDPSIWGLDFKVQLQRADLYLGKLSNKNRPDAVLESGGAQGGNSSLDVSKRKQNRALLITQPSNTTTQTLTIPSPNPANVEYDLRFRLADLPLPDIGIFSTILEFLLFLAAQDPHQAVESANLASDILPVWIYVFHNTESGSTRELQVYQVVAILQAIARYCVEQRIYQELIFNLMIDNVMVAAGCVVKGLREREWCRGLEGWRIGGGLGLVGLDLRQNISVTA